MSNLPSNKKSVSYALGSLLLFFAINAFGGGYYGMTGAKMVPQEWLNGSPFHNYFIPGLILFVSVGGSAFVSAILVFKQHRLARKATFCCGIIVLGWISVQVAIIGYVSWLQPVIAIVAVLIILLTYLLPRH